VNETVDIDEKKRLTGGGGGGGSKEFDRRPQQLRTVGAPAAAAFAPFAGKRDFTALVADCRERYTVDDTPLGLWDWLWMGGT